MGIIGRNINVNIEGLKKLHQNLQQFTENESSAFVEECAKHLAARLLRKVKKRTIPGIYGTRLVKFTTKEGIEVEFTSKAKGKKGGTLRRNWMIEPITRHGDTYKIEIINMTNYASYVEYGHRTRNHKGWIPGKFMLTISEQELQAVAPAILEKKLKKKLEECLK